MGNTCRCQKLMHPLYACVYWQVIQHLQELSSAQEIGFNLGTVQAFAFQVEKALLICPHPNEDFHPSRLHVIGVLRSPVLLGIQIRRWPEEIQELAASLSERLALVEEQQASRLNACYSAFAAALMTKGDDSGRQLRHLPSEKCIRMHIANYFSRAAAPCGPSPDHQGVTTCGDPQEEADTLSTHLPFVPVPRHIRGDAHALNRLGVGTLTGQDLSGTPFMPVDHHSAWAVDYSYACRLPLRGSSVSYPMLAILMLA